VPLKKFKDANDLSQFALTRGSSFEHDGRVFNSGHLQRKPTKAVVEDAKQNEGSQAPNNAYSLEDLANEIKRQAQVIDMLIQENKALTEAFESKMSDLQKALAQKPAAKEPSELIFTAAYDASGRITQLKTTRKQ
jgi:hypothetical protein